MNPGQLASEKPADLDLHNFTKQDISGLIHLCNPRALSPLRSLRA